MKVALRLAKPFQLMAGVRSDADTKGLGLRSRGMEGRRMSSLIAMKAIDKRFPGVHALKSVEIDLRAGEVHALMGENGAGKSTLMKVLSGVYQADGGQIDMDGKPVEFPNPKAAQDAGICIIHQELLSLIHI